MKKIPLSENSDSADTTHKIWKDVYNAPKNTYDDLLYDYQRMIQDDIFTQKMFITNTSSELSITPQKYATQVDTSKTSPSYNKIDITQLKQLMNVYMPRSTGKTYSQSWDYDTFQYAPRLDRYEKKVDVVMDDGSIESISREDLIKYISEQRIVRENEVVRKVYERYQVAVKLVRSDDNGDTGV
jgi:hypothetical protein